MKVCVFQIFFKADGNGGLIPMDPDLFTLASQYANEYMTSPIDLTTYKHFWVACEVDEEGKPLRALGILGLVFRPDVSVFRFTDNAAVVKLVQRANDAMHDAYGARGMDVLIHIPADEPVEHQCPDRKQWMEAFGLRPADRWLIRVK